MREARMKWSSDAIANSDFSKIGSICDSIEVLAHLDVKPDGVRQLVKASFYEGKGAKDLDTLGFIEVESDSTDINSTGQTQQLVIWNSHPLSVEAIRFDNIHILPPYTFGGEGIDIGIIGTLEGVSGFLKTARNVFPPSKVIVSDRREAKELISEMMTEKQFEIVKFAAQAGYYQNPRKTTLKEIAEMLDKPKSTIQEHLKNAESRLILWAVSSMEE